MKLTLLRFFELSFLKKILMALTKCPDVPATHLINIG